MKNLCLALLIMGLTFHTNATKVRYDNYKLFRFVPKNESELKVLLSLEDHSPAVLFWKDVSQIGQPCDVLFPPHLLEMAKSIKDQGISTTEVISNVQRLIDEEEIELLRAVRSTKLTWDNYYSTETIHQFLDEQASLHPTRAKIISAGSSHEGRDLKIIKIFSNSAKKPAIWIDANIHAREWITNTVATYIINELLNNENDLVLKQVSNDFDFYIMPVMNPDGYEYSRTKDRMWRKTRTKVSSTCVGVDANRNFGFHWKEGGSSSNPCSEIYAGPKAFSEIETKSIADFYSTIGQDVKLCLSLHSYSQLILLPYAYTDQKYEHFSRDLEIAKNVSAAIKSRYNTTFTSGNTVDILYQASGSSMDWMTGHHNHSPVFSATFELRDTGEHGFVLPTEYIKPSCEEMVFAIKSFAAKVKHIIKP